MADSSGGTGQRASGVKCFFLDEAGDPTLFSRHGRLLVGTPGCSRFFIVGFVAAADPDALGRNLNGLRARLLADPYFAGVPSMRLEQRKTAIAFHAKDDLPEVRREVFAMLQRHRLRFTAIVRDKSRVADDVNGINRWNKAYRYNPNDLYYDMVRRLFRENLHIGEIRVHFAVRGSKPRTEAFRESVRQAQADFAKKWGTASATPVTILPGRPAQYAGLQAVDYFVWTLQRFYERGEDRFLNLLWPQYATVVDLDDERQSSQGTYYTEKRPLTRAALESRLGGI